jgi:hypothetical protein
VNKLLVSMVAMVARRYGPRAAMALLRAGQRWLADPANEPARQALLVRLRGVTQGGGGAGRLAAGLVRQIEARRSAVGPWERTMMELRYEAAELPSGPDRAAVVDAYVAQIGLAAQVADGGDAPQRQVLMALDNEERAIRSEALGPDERRRALDAVGRAREESRGRAAA